MTTLQEKINDVLQDEQDILDGLDTALVFDMGRMAAAQRIRIMYEELNDTDVPYTSPEWIRRKRRKLKLLVDEYYKDYVYLCGPR